MHNFFHTQNEEDNKGNMGEKTSIEISDVFGYEKKLRENIPILSLELKKKLFQHPFYVSLSDDQKLFFEKVFDILKMEKYNKVFYDFMGSDFVSVDMLAQVSNEDIGLLIKNIQDDYADGEDMISAVKNIIFFLSSSASPLSQAVQVTINNSGMDKMDQRISYVITILSEKLSPAEKEKYLPQIQEKYRFIVSKYYSERMDAKFISQEDIHQYAEHIVEDFRDVIHQDPNQEITDVLFDIFDSYLLMH